MKVAAIVINIFLPGVGTLFVKKWGQAIFQIILATIALALNLTGIGGLIGLPLGIAVWIWAIVSAISTAVINPVRETRPEWAAGLPLLLTLGLGCAAHAQEMQMEGRTVLVSAFQDYERQALNVSPFSGGSNADVRIAFPELTSAGRFGARGLPRGWAQPDAGTHLDTPPAYRGNIAPNLSWRGTANGRVMATVSLESPGVAAFRAQLRAVLSSGASIRYFELSSDGGSTLLHEHSIEPSRNASAQTVTLWSPTMETGRMGVEIILPNPESASGFSLEVPGISVQSRTAGGAASAPDMAFSPRCANHVDAQCSSDTVLRSKAAAVGRILVEKNGQPTFCTGTLINSRAPRVDDLTLGDGPAPYLLTSSNCIATQQEADSMEVTWFYENSSCGSEGLDHRTATTFGGGELLATGVAQGSSLIRLRRDLPGGLVYSGWRASELLTPANVGAIHHPGGTVKKAATGQAESHLGQGSLSDAIRVQWDEGAAENGSEGAGLFANGYLVGVLAQPGESCDSGISHFGAFDAFFPRIEGYLLGDHPDNPITATQIAVPASIRAALYEGDLDYFEIEITQDGKLAVYSEGDTNTKAQLIGGGGLVAEDDDGGLNANFLIEADVTPGTYQIVVRGGGEDENNSVSGEYTLRTSLDNAGPPTAAPTNVRVEREGSSLTVSWDAVPAAANSGSPITGYTALATDSQGQGESCWAPANMRSCVIAGLRAEVEFSVYVRAANGLGEGPDSSSVSVRIAAASRPGAPPVLEGVKVGIGPDAGTINVEWQPLPKESRTDDLAYKVEALSGEESLSCEAGPTELSCSVSVPESSVGVEYSVTAYAENAQGAGPRSLPVHVTPLESEDGHPDSWSDANSVKMPSITAANIVNSSDEDWFRVDVLDAGTLYVWTQGETNTTLVRLRSGAFTDLYRIRTALDELKWDGGGPDSGQGDNLWYYKNVSPGTYYFAVQGATGDYALHVDLVEDDHGNTYRDATRVATDSTTPSYLAHGDEDWFRVDVLDAGTLYVWTQGETNTTLVRLRSGAFTDLYRIRTALDELKWDGGGPDSGQGDNLWYYKNVSPGTYYFAVRGEYGDTTGDYSLHVDFVEDDHGNTYRDATRVATDSTTPSYLAHGDEDWFSVEITEAGTLYVETQGDTNTAMVPVPGCRTFCWLWALRTEKEDLSWDSGDNDGGQGSNLKHHATLSPGVYYFAVRGSNIAGHVSAYQLVVSFSPTESESGFLPELRLPWMRKRPAQEEAPK